MDAVFDSVSIATTFKEELSKAGVVFCSISEAVREMPDLVRKHLGSVVRRIVSDATWLAKSSEGQVIARQLCTLFVEQSSSAAWCAAARLLYHICLDAIARHAARRGALSSNSSAAGMSAARSSIAAAAKTCRTLLACTVFIW